ncbi:MAG: galactose-1-epimerase, partial [Steroidobacteraceae bacterium]
MQRRATFVLAMIACTVFDAAGAVSAASASRVDFGALPDGRRAEAVTLRNSKGLAATVITYGAALQSLLMPDRDGTLSDVVLGYASLEGYLAKPEYFGGSVGRFANRIAKGRFTLDGKVYQTPQNNNGNALHGGERGFDKVLWEIVALRQGAAPSVTLRYVS